jgi:hypothetical protein
MTRKNHRRPLEQRVTVCIPQAMYVRLTEQSEAMDVPMAWLVRRAVEQALDPAPEPDRPEAK